MQAHTLQSRQVFDNRVNERQADLSNWQVSLFRETSAKQMTNWNQTSSGELYVGGVGLPSDVKGSSVTGAVGRRRLPLPFTDSAGCDQLCAREVRSLGGPSGWKHFRLKRPGADRGCT
jgi:hypothetical protein